MRKTLQAALLVLVFMAVIVLNSIPVFADEETEFTPVTANGYGYSAEEWYNSEMYNALLCYSLLVDSNDITAFFESGEPKDAYILDIDDGLLGIFYNIGDNAILYTYVPGAYPVYRTMAETNIEPQFAPQLIGRGEVKYKAITSDGWSDMYEFLGITKEVLQGTESTASSTHLEKGSKGEDVKTVQERLIELGYLVGTADGDFGKKTEVAVEAFQKAYSLEVTGIVTDVEMRAMNELPEIIASVPTETPEVVIGNLTINNCKDLAKILKSKDPNAPIIKEFAEKYSGMTIEFDGNIAYMNNHGDYNTRYDILVHAGKYSESSALGPDFQFEDVGVIDLGLSGLYMTDLINIGDKVHIIAVVGDYRESSGLFKLNPVSVIVK